MTKSELIDALAARSELTKARAELVVNCVFEAMTEALQRGEGIEGLIYSAELSADKVEKPSDVVAAGQTVTALVTRVDPVDQKISLSIRALTNKEERAALKRLAAELAASQTTTLGDLLKEKLGRKAEE